VLSETTAYASVNKDRPGSASMTCLKQKRFACRKWERREA
jgi:hypothetical protein